MSSYTGPRIIISISRTGGERHLMRRACLLAVVVLAVLAGCSNPAERTPEPIEASASQATVNDAALSETGYAESTLEAVQVNRSGTLSISGDVQMDLGYQVRATGWRAVYRATDGAAVFALYTVPLAQPQNVAVMLDPLGDRSLATVVGQSQDSFDDPAALEHVENRTTAVLGEETVVRTYETTASYDGEPTDVVVRIAQTEHDGDVVRAVAVAPEDGDTGSWPTVERLLDDVEHG